MKISKLPKELLSKLPYELWMMIDKYNARNFLNKKLKTIRPRLHSYKIVDIDSLPCQRFVYRNGLFEWKINHYIDDDITTFCVILFKNKVVGKFDVIN